MYKKNINCLKKFKPCLRRGFTLIELLVVIAIIGLLSTIVVASLSTVRAKARDTKRVADLKSLQLALEMYYDTNRYYPPIVGTSNNASTNLAVLTPTFISTIPKDPLGSDYTYVACKNGGSTASGYHMGASLEDPANIAMGSDSDSAQDTTNCGGDFSGTNKAAPSSTAGVAGCGNSATGNDGGAGVETCFDIKR